MSPPQSRRATIIGGCTGLIALLAGCSQAPTTDSSNPTSKPGTQPFDTPTSDGCEPSALPQPTPVNTFQPKEYPEYPKDLTVGAAEGFAHRFEEAFQYNRYLATTAGPDTRSINIQASVEGSLTEKIQNGILIAVEGELSTEEQTVIRDDPIVGVYFCTPKFALRGEISEPTLYQIESLRSVTVKNKQTIFCQTSL